MDKKILVVDDEQDLREAIADSLRAEGYEVIEGKDGKEGLALALKHKPDLTLLDIMMPKMNGHKVLHELRLDQWGKTANVVLLTNLSDAANVTTGIQQGSDKYLIKTSLKLEEIVKKVKQYLVGYH